MTRLVLTFLVWRVRWVLLMVGALIGLVGLVLLSTPSVGVLPGLPGLGNPGATPLGVLDETGRLADVVVAELATTATVEEGHVVRGAGASIADLHRAAQRGAIDGYVVLDQRTLLDGSVRVVAATRPRAEVMTAASVAGLRAAQHDLLRRAGQEGLAERFAAGAGLRWVGDVEVVGKQGWVERERVVEHSDALLLGVGVGSGLMFVAVILAQMLVTQVGLEEGPKRDLEVLSLGADTELRAAGVLGGAIGLVLGGVVAAAVLAWALFLPDTAGGLAQATLRAALAMVGGSACLGLGYLGWFAGNRVSRAVPTSRWNFVPPTLLWLAPWASITARLGAEVTGSAWIVELGSYLPFVGMWIALPGMIGNLDLMQLVGFVVSAAASAWLVTAFARHEHEARALLVAADAWITARSPFSRSRPS